MTALYPSTSAAQVFVPSSVRLTTTGASAPIAPDYADPANYADFGFFLFDPTGDRITLGQIPSLPEGITVQMTELSVVGFVVTIDQSFFTMAGQYSCAIQYNAVANYSRETVSFQWGGWIDTLLSSTANAEGASEICQNVLTGSYDVDDPAVPTVQTLSVSGTPYATRTIANADGSAINPSQVLILGELTQVP